MTDREKAIVMAYTDVCMLQGDKLSVFYDYVAEIMGSRMNILQMAMLADEIKRKAEPDFIKLCEDVPDKNVGGKWISVKDGLPERYKHVLVATRFTDEGERDTEIAYFSLGGWRKPEGILYGTVTHWMPLPEPPKEE